MATKLKIRMLQSRLTFTKDGGLKCEIPHDDESKPPLPSSKKSRPMVKQRDATSSNPTLGYLQGPDWILFQG